MGSITCQTLSRAFLSQSYRNLTRFDFKNGITEHCLSPIAVARQLTHIEMEKLSMIGPEEFVYAFMKDSKPLNGHVTSLSEFRKTQNIEHYADWFNRLSRLVASEICKNLKKTHRVRLIEFFIDVAKECWNIGNFNSLMAVVAGLNNNSVKRLKKTVKIHSNFKIRRLRLSFLFD